MITIPMGDALAILAGALGIPTEEFLRLRNMDEETERAASRVLVATYDALVENGFHPMQTMHYAASVEPTWATVRDMIASATRKDG